MKVKLFTVETKVENPYKILNEWFETEPGLWLMTNIPSTKITIQRKLSHENFEFYYDVVADMDLVDYVCWKLKFT